jgi:hypothetical protein
VSIVQPWPPSVNSVAWNYAHPSETARLAEALRYSASHGVSTHSAAQSPLELGQLGEGAWLDGHQRGMLEDGSLAPHRRGCIAGLTSNPAIFANSIATTTRADRAAAARRPPWPLYEELVLHDPARGRPRCAPFMIHAGDGFVPGLPFRTPARRGWQPRRRAAPVSRLRRPIAPIKILDQGRAPSSAI